MPDHIGQMKVQHCDVRFALRHHVDRLSATVSNEHVMASMGEDRAKQVRIPG
jgi:hypothetical protein